MDKEAFQEARAWCRLLRCGAGAAGLRRLAELAGSARAALDAPEAQWRQCGIRPGCRAAALRTPEDPRDPAWLDAPGRRVLGWGDPDYPGLLAQAPSPPAALFVEGRVGLLHRAQVAVVGTRRPSPSGRDHASRFACALARAGLVVTSGLARGVDAAAHAAALDAGAGTVAVTATGPDQCYPRANRALWDRIRVEGAVVTEHLPGTPPRPQQFPSRNRIVAGLSLGTLVVEAAERSGALISARLAAEAGREVFALPGAVSNPMARGCHRLIRDGAALVESPGEVVEALLPVAKNMAQALHPGGDAPTPGDSGGDLFPAPAPADALQRRLYEALGHEPVDLDELASRTGLTVPRLSSMLLLMELQGLVGAVHGRYVRRP